MCNRKLCTADKAWKSLDAASLDKAYDTIVPDRCLASTDLESYPSSKSPTLPPPAKFFISRRKQSEMMETRDAGASSPLTPSSCSSTDNVLSFLFEGSVGSDSPVLQGDYFYLAEYAPQPLSPQKAARRNLQRKVNFALGLQNEAERRRQGCSWR
jgi:hypothetical protein